MFMLKFYVKVFRTSLLPNLLMDLVYVWYNDGYWSKLIWGTIPTPVYVTLRSRSQTLNFYVEDFIAWFFPNPVMYFIHVWYDDKILVQNFTAYHSLVPYMNLKVRVMDIEFLCESFFLKNASERKSAIQASCTVRRQVLFYCRCLCTLVALAI